MEYKIARLSDLFKYKCIVLYVIQSLNTQKSTKNINKCYTNVKIWTIMKSIFWDVMLQHWRDADF